MAVFFVCVTACTFAFFLVLSVVQIIGGEKEEVRERLKRIFSGQAEKTDRKIRRIQKKKENKLPGIFKTIGQYLSDELSRSGIKLRGEEFLFIWTVLTLLPWGLFLLYKGDWLVFFAFSLLGFVLPVFMLKRAKNKRIALFEEQLSSALIIMGNCLRSGLSFPQALDSIVRDMPEPISKEFGRVVKEIRFGVSMEKALDNLAARIKSKDFTLLVSAVLIQRQVGGNLSEILTNISDTIRDRLKIKGNIKVLTTTGRASGKIVGLIPAFILLVLMVINPDYVRSFFETQAGIIMLVLAAGLELIGFMVIQKVSRIKF